MKTLVASNLLADFGHILMADSAVACDISEGCAHTQANQPWTLSSMMNLLLAIANADKIRVPARFQEFAPLLRLASSRFNNICSAIVINEYMGQIRRRT